MGHTATDRQTGRRSYDQACPVAHSLDLLGERWTLLIVRDLMFGPLRFTDLRDGLPGLAPNLLSDRLRFLAERGVIEQAERRSPGSRNVYRLTPRGRELSPVIHALARFGVHEWADPDAAPPTPRLLRGALLALMTPEALDDSAWSAVIELPQATVGLRVRARDGSPDPLGRLTLTQPTEDQTPHTARVTSTLGTLRDLRRGAVTVAAAQRHGTLEYRGGDRVGAQLAALLSWDESPTG